MLSGVNVALGVTGSIAAVRTVQLAHELRRRGAAVRAVCTDGATGIVNPWALEFATDRPVVTEITGAVEHVELCGREGWADVLCIAPATGNTVGKVAAAVDDTPVTTCATTAIGAGLPVVVAPAMHEPMYDHPGIVDALDCLREWDIDVVPPRIDEGKAKLASDDAVATAVARAVGPGDLDGRHVVVTAGATAESVDPVRLLTNRSSGRTGRAVARACYARGADVTVVHARGHGGESSADGGSADGGGAAVPSLPGLAVRRVESAAEMTAVALEAAEEADALISAAAISDYTVEPRDEKIPSGESSLTLELTPTEKLLDAVRDARPDLTMVGFKVETDADDETLVRRARETAERVDLAFVVANDAAAMGSTGTRALLVRADDVESYEGDKAGLGEHVAAALAAELDGADRAV